jgi:hypothetical protein
MVFCQKIMIPAAGMCLIVGLFVYDTHFDSHYSGPYAGDWTRHISPKLHPDGSILRALFLGGLFGMGGPFMWGVFTSAVLYSNTIPDADSS